jgi:2-polyprenyl-3-methyl-5-hydroxy-6-metoxy-1,4-benzoquinol methylase
MGEKITSIYCPVCSNNNYDLFLESIDFFLTKESFSIVKCDRCGFKITHPRPKQEEISIYYNSSEYISHTNSQKGFLNRLYYLVRNFTLYSKVRLIKKYKKSGDILDIGCGTGEFLKKISEKGFIVTGVEPGNNAREYAQNQNEIFVIDEKSMDEKLTPSSYDVITMWHVMEHVYNLNSRISQISKLLSEKGLLIIAVPNSDSWDARYYQKFWAAYDLPRHLYHFNQKDIKLLFQKEGYTLVRIKPMIFDSFYISLLSEKYKNSKSNFLKAFLLGFVSNVWAAMNSNNYSSLIYIYKRNKT